MIEIFKGHTFSYDVPLDLPGMNFFIYEAFIPLHCKVCTLTIALPILYYINATYIHKFFAEEINATSIDHNWVKINDTSKILSCNEIIIKKILK